MPKFRKKLIEIEAIQYTGTPESLAEILAWAKADAVVDHSGPSGKPHLYIYTEDGSMWARPGDWVVKGTEGDFRPCSPYHFESLYEPVE